jgi:hypothetical protein
MNDSTGPLCVRIHFFLYCLIVKNKKRNQATRQPGNQATRQPMKSNLVYKNGDATTALDPAVWGPHYWFVLFSMAVTYPERPNDVTIKKYYEFIQNLPLFLPNHQMGNAFSELLDKYPVSPYLDKRESFIKWVHFLHNQINLRLNRDEVSLQDAVNAYYSNYKPKELRLREEFKYRRKLIYSLVALTTATTMYYLYYK